MSHVTDDLAAAIVAARLTPDEAQVVFRRLLDALARPGRMAWLPADVARRVPPALVPVLALCDLEVTCCVVARADQHVDWAEVVATATGARRVGLAESAWVAALDRLSGDDIAQLRRGTALAPEQGARLVHACRQLHVGEGSQPWSSADHHEAVVTIELTGPGIPDRRRISITGVDPEVFDALAAANQAFPAGVDTWLVADSGALIGLPRTIRIAVLARTHHTGGH
jgi:alpha-D-ribose 1-methylphosphonate 5-triphosphate synthase subunit PhnH